MKGGSNTLKPNENIRVIPFRLDVKSSQLPSEFEILFIHKNKLYQYGIKLTKQIVLEEWLFEYKSSKPTKLFQRNYNKKKKENEWYFSSYLKGDKSSLANKTRNNSLFISTAVQFNHSHISNIFTWFSEFIDVFFTNETEELFKATTYFLSENENMRDFAMHFIRQADLGISGIQCDFDLVNEDDLESTLPNTLKKELINRLNSNPELKFQLIHQNKNNKSILFDLDEESNGTIKLCSLIGPILNSVTLGGTLFLDELDANLHTYLAKYILQFWFYNKEMNDNGSQLIFTTHDTSLLDKELFRRDQIWFTEKNQHGESVLYPLTDYKPRKDESIQKGYLAGRYGGIPMLSNTLPMP